MFRSARALGVETGARQGAEVGPKLLYAVSGEGVESLGFGRGSTWLWNVILAPSIPGLNWFLSESVFTVDYLIHDNVADCDQIFLSFKTLESSIQGLQIM